ncbi:MAG: hypothetical protein ACI8P3_003679 [Saprospiraceae bacterium]|jgi:hypothetical protein
MEVSVNKSSLNYDHMLGSWKNSYLKSKGISNFILNSDSTNLSISITGTPNGLVSGNWGTTPLSPFAYKPTQEKADGFIGNFTSPEFDALLCIYNNKGLIVLEAVIQFKGDSDLNNWMVREFFFHENS